MQLKLSKYIQMTQKLVFYERPLPAAERPVFSPFFLLFSFFPSLLLQGRNWNNTTKIAYHPLRYILPNLRGKVPIFRPIRFSPHSNFIPISFQFLFQFRSNCSPSTNQSARSNFIFRTDAILVSRITYSRYFQRLFLELYCEFLDKFSIDRFSSVTFIDLSRLVPGNLA